MTALITGAGSGMGLEYARQLAGKGYALALVDIDGEKLAAASALSEEFGIPVHTLVQDLSEPGCAEKVTAWCDGNGLRIDLLVNNAGIFFMKYLEPSDLGKVRTMTGLHVETVTELCILFGARMKENGGGRILNMSSMTARIPAPGIALYSATKAYLKSFGKSISYEMRPYGVTVTTVCPAAVDTGLYPLGDRLRRTLRRFGIIRTPEWLVKKSLKATFRGRRTVSPGLMNALLPPLVALLPGRTIERLGIKWIRRG